MNNVHFAIPEIYGETLSYYELLRKLVDKTNDLIDNYNTVPEQIAEAVANLDASQLFSTVLKQLIESIATDNTKSTNAVKVYKKHDLLYATFNETVNLYESLINFSTGTETELIVGSNIREVNISELIIELRKLIDNEAQEREQVDNLLQQSIDTERSAREQADNLLQQSIDTERSAREQADNTKANKSDVLSLEEIQASTDLSGKIAGASGLKEISIKVTGIDNAISLGYSGENNSLSFIPNEIGNGIFVIFADGGYNIVGLLLVSNRGYRILYQGNTLISKSGNKDDTVNVDVGAWYVRLMARKIADAN